ncbi:hypothetical protein ACVILL_007104 [Bradyrhizobium sp. USDA 3364]
MAAASDDQTGFAPDDDAPIGYMKRTRDYYAAIGYTTPYRWAHYTSAPFQPLKKPLNQSRIAIITTAGAIRSRPRRPGSGREIQWRGQVLFGL